MGSGSPTLRPRPFSFQPEELMNLGREMEVPTSSGQAAPRFAANSESKELSQIPNQNPQRSQIWGDEPRAWSTANDIPPYPPRTVGREVGSDLDPVRYGPPRSPTQRPQSPGLQRPSSPTPPMTTSSYKIFQLTGFDPRFERAFPIEHQQIPTPPQSPVRRVSSSSSGSVYSQAEVGFQPDQARPHRYSSSSIAQAASDEEEQPASSTDNISEPGFRSSDASREFAKNRVAAAQAGATQSALAPEQEEPRRPTFPAGVSTHSTEVLALPEILAQENPHYSSGGKGAAGGVHEYSHPLKETGTTPHAPRSPNPLALPLKSSLKTRGNERMNTPGMAVASPKKASFFRSARDSLEWGIYDLSTKGDPSDGKPSTTPVSPMFTMESDHMTLSPPLGSFPSPKTTKRIFGSGRHPLKSPFPFSKSHSEAAGFGRSMAPAAAGDEEAAEIVPSPSTPRGFTRRLSNTVKQLSPTSPTRKNKTPPLSSEKAVLANGERRAAGPATPTTPKNGFMESVVGKVKKSVVGVSKEEKRRESLRERIVVVGITDQSPGMLPPL
ncbi:hypothetical protein QTJ16_002788 [Diplocarpon rosae]|uniref:Uncharacterized protein n=1 Tax=Diplocarpon rosae TaxID=946125 RepID=A0AAD9WDZ0_9HELO|nr:hypothetical protein QTJ16_002788 [Diplocarpon rosae]